MRKRFTSWLINYWYPIPLVKPSVFALSIPFLLGLSKVYFLLWQHRQKQLNKRSLNQAQTHKPYIVVIGNITVGGTGKTPLLIHTAQQLIAEGFRVAVLSRGYGGSHEKNKNHAHLISTQDSSDFVGDEPLLIYNTLNNYNKSLGNTSEIPVAVSANRPLSLELLSKDCQCDVVLSDDGLQHYKLPRDFEVVLIDGQRGFGNGKLLPQGPLREPVSSLTHVDTVIVNDAVSVALKQQLNRLGIQPTQMQVMLDKINSLNAVDEYHIKNINELFIHYHQVYAIAGIGNPQRFFQQLEQALLQLHSHDKALNTQLLTQSFPDHHLYLVQDFDKICKKVSIFNTATAILMTEKDAIKCTSLLNGLDIAVYSIGSQLCLDNNLSKHIMHGLKGLPSQQSLF